MFRPILYRSLEVTWSSNVRVMTYLLPTFIFSVLLNIPKFLEARHESVVMVDDDNTTHTELIYTPTSLRYYKCQVESR